VTSLLHTHFAAKWATKCQFCAKTGCLFPTQYSWPVLSSSFTQISKRHRTAITWSSAPNSSESSSILTNCCVLHIANSTQTYDRFVGAVVDWNTNGYMDLIFPMPATDRKCSADTSCTKHPYFSSKCPTMFYVSAVSAGIRKRGQVVAHGTTQHCLHFSAQCLALPPLLKRYFHFVVSSKPQIPGVMPVRTEEQPSGGDYGDVSRPACSDVTLATMTSYEATYLQ
jgi:hypothetical protein